MAEAFYGLPDEFRKKAYEYTTRDMHRVMREFDAAALPIKRGEG